MPYVIGGLVVVVLVIFIVSGVTMVIAHLTALLALPSISAMKMVQSLGLTGPGWYVVLHAMLGAAYGLWAHRLFGNSRKRPSTGGKKGLWARMGGEEGLWARMGRRRWLKVILIVVLVIVFFNMIPPAC